MNKQLFLDNAIRIKRVENIDIITIAKPFVLTVQFPEEISIVSFACGIHELTCRCFGSQFREIYTPWEAKSAITSSYGVFLFDETKLIGCGFANKIVDMDTSYLYRGVIEKEYQNKGLGTILLQERIDLCQTKYIVLGTQNPMVYRNLRKFCPQIFPSLANENSSQEIHDIAYNVIGQHIAQYNPETHIGKVKDLICYYDTIPSSYDEEIDSWFEKNLHIKKRLSTHQVILVGVIEKEAHEFDL